MPSSYQTMIELTIETTFGRELGAKCFHQAAATMHDLAGSGLPWYLRDKGTKTSQMKASSAKPFTELVVLDTNPVPSRPRKMFKRCMRRDKEDSGVENIPGDSNKLSNRRTEDDKLGASSLEKDARNKPVRNRLRMEGHFDVVR